MADDRNEVMAVPIDEPSCRICWSSDEPFDMIQPCKCEGTAAHVHTKCLEDWLRVNASENCVACRARYRLPRRVECRRAFTRLIRGCRWMMATTFAIFLLTSIVAKPVGLLVWFAFSASSTNPFESPMLLYVLKAQESLHGIEEDVDLALSGRPDKLLQRLRFRPGDCETFVRYMKNGNIEWLTEMLEPTLNSTCEWHPQFAAPTRYRFCSCYDQRPIARQLAQTLVGLSARCVGAGGGGGADDDEEPNFFPISLWTIFDFFTTSTKSLLDYMLPLAYDRHADTLLLLKFTPRKVNWFYEIFNPRFYGLPFSIAVHTEKFSFTPDELVIKGLDLHFGVLVTVGMLADVILLVRLIVFHGINPVEPLFPLEWEDHAETPNGGWIGSTVNYTKAVIKEQIESFMVAAVINYQSAKVWWYESTWESVLADLGGFLVILGLGLLLYMYIMAITSVVVLRMVETDILY